MKRDAIQHKQEMVSTDDARFRALAEAITDFLWITSADGTLEEDSVGWQAFTGLEPTDYKGWDWLQAFHADDREHIKEVWLRAIATRQIAEDEARIRRHDGVYRIFHLRIMPVQDETGCVYECIGSGTDISERKQLEQALAERISQLEAVFAAMADGVFVYDRQGQLIQMNKAADELFIPGGAVDLATHSLEERLSLLTVRDLQGHPLSREDWPMQRIMHGEVLKERNAMDVLLRSLDGRELQVSVSGAPMLDQQGKVIGAVGIVRDVTKRRRLEQMERQMHAETEARLALLQLILDELPSSVYFVRGTNARLILANRAATTLWGAIWQRGQPLEAFLISNRIRLLGLDGQPLTSEQLAIIRAVRQGEMIYQQQEIIRHADGTTLPVLVNAVALDVSRLGMTLAGATNEEGDAAEPAALVVFQDVTALKEAEALKDEFIGIAAHELRTPLAALQGFAQTLAMQSARGRGTALADWQLEAVREIEQAALRLSDLTEDLLDVTRLQAGRLALQREPTDLVALAQRVIKRLQITSERHHLSLHTTLPHMVVDADPQRLEQVFINLLGNAIKYSPQGGPIEVTLQQGETYGAILSVRDYGIGIPTQQQARIFSRFMRADNARRYGVSGTGLGLYLSRELAELHGGRIWFESVEEQGSTFYLALP